MIVRSADGSEPLGAAMVVSYCRLVRCVLVGGRTVRASVAAGVRLLLRGA